ncbi:DUF3592 domain-containing protein [Variovorax paradoxus]|uniref:DUF3592 domain-containing protein n=1 Tax=Variovorax paradoxus TaxID=34073 RepID=UPI003D648303
MRGWIIADEVASGALGIFALALVVGLLVGGLITRLRTLNWGTGIGALMIGSAGLYGAATIGLDRLQFLSNTVLVKGTVVEFVHERIEAGMGRVLIGNTRARATLVPVVEYTTPDGKSWRVKGLDGGLPGKVLGDAIEIRYNVADPTQARLTNFQNVWGIVWGFAMLGGLPALFGLFFIRLAFEESRQGGQRCRWRQQPTRAQLRWRTRGTVFANLIFISGFAVFGLYPGDSTARALGAGFTTIGTGVFMHFVVQSLPPRTALESRGTIGILGAVLMASGVGVWMMAF